MPLRLTVAVELCQIEPFEVGPPVIERRGGGRQRHCRLLFVEQCLDKNVGMGPSGIPVEDELDIGGHREDARAYPAFCLKAVDTEHLYAAAVEVEQAGQRHDHCLVPEAERGAGTGQGKARIGRGDDVAQQVPLRERLCAAVLGRTAIVQIPPDVGTLPEPVPFVGGKEAVQRQRVAYLGVLDDACQTEEVVCQLRRVDVPAGIGRVCKEP